MTTVTIYEVARDSDLIVTSPDGTPCPVQREPSLATIRCGCGHTCTFERRGSLRDRARREARLRRTDGQCPSCYAASHSEGTP